MTQIFTAEFQKLFEAMPIPLAYFQRKNDSIVPVMVTDNLCEILHCSREALLRHLTTDPLELIHPKDRERISRNLDEFISHLRSFDVFYRSRHGSDEEYHMIHSVGKFQTLHNGSEMVLFTFTDVSDIQSVGWQIAENFDILQKDRFYTDSLTGLPNLNYLLEFCGEKLNKIRQSGKTPAMLYFDVVGLRAYNLQYGFSGGDALLKLIADMLKSVYPEDTIVRGADDHFVVLRPYISPDVTAKLIDTLNDKIKASANGNTSGVQAGICVMEADMNIQDAMDHAKHALRQIGNDLNKTHIYYTQETDENYWNQRYILETFEQALENEWIKVYYQAIMRVSTGNAAALEALARWVDPLRGIISPGEFIPVLEKYHYLYKLDLYMVEQICKEVPLRKKVGLPIIPVTVNFSAQDFDHADIVSSLNEIFERHQLNKDHIIIEITEQDLAKATEHFKKQINALQDSGYRIWIDDFGSGYSSLNIFSQYKVNVTKFDIEFLRHLDDNNSANRLIMRSMTEVFRKMGIACLAEGVETEEQLEFLRQINCEYAQGFYYYKPQSLGAIIFKIQKGNPIIKCETHEEMLRHREFWDNISRHPQ